MKKINYVKISILLYLISLFVPVFDGGAPGLIGISAIFTGWIGIFGMSLLFGIPWFANVLFVAALMFRNKFLTVRIFLSFLSVSFALVTLGITEIPIDEGGATANVSVGVGFFIWLSSFIVLLIGQIKEIKKPQKLN
jgi:ABC-type Na+ efflux pump permease subunit